MIAIKGMEMPKSKYNYENSCDYDGWGVNDDYFCAKGERREQCQE